MYIALYFIVTCLSDSLSAVKDLFLAMEPTDLTVDLLEKHLLTAEASIVAVGAARGTPRTPFFEGCSPSPLAPSYASTAVVDFLHAEEVGAVSSPSGRRCSGRGKRGKGVGMAAVEVVEAMEVAVMAKGVVVGVEALVAAVVAVVGVVAAALVAAVGVVAAAVVAAGVDPAKGEVLAVCSLPVRHLHI
ncbi:unnamed protein product [Closterium sp. NIES-65]|nr:unnamed protein product [Closterium sp. NIES-65]